MPELVFRVLAFAAGAFLVASTVLAAIQSFVLPRNESALLNTWVFRAVRRGFEAMAALGHTYSQRDRVMALYAPVGLVTLPIVWLTVVSVGYTAIFWALDEGNLVRCYRISASSLLTIGADEPTHGLVASIMSYSEATLGLLLLTLLISYLPTMYQAFSRRELTVARLELRAGAKASAVELLLWLNRTGSFQDDSEQWKDWEEWFVEIEETHTSLAILAFFRSPQPGRSWVTAADVILDAAALISSTVAQPRDPHLVLCFKAGCVAINRVARYFRYEADVTETSGVAPVEPQRHDFDLACRQLRAAGVELQEEQAAWEQYMELRSRYAGAIAYLAKLIMAPEIKPI